MSGGKGTSKKQGKGRARQKASYVGKRDRPTIGVLAGWQVYAASLHGYLDPLLKGACAAAQDRECNLLLSCGVTRVSIAGSLRPAWPVPSPDSDFVPVGPWNTDGLLVAVPLGSESRSRDVQQFIADGHHVVFIGAGEEGPSVVFDNADGIRQAVAHLVEHGHRRIAFLAGYEEQVEGDSTERFRAYMEAVQEYGLEADPRLVVYGHHNVETGYVAARQLVESGAEFTAMVASNDQSAVGAMRAFKELGLRIPQDVAMIGFDDIVDAVAQTPPLTTVRAPVFEMGYRGLELLLERIAGKPGPEDVMVPARLVVRQSCGCTHGAALAPSAGDLKKRVSRAAQQEVRAELVQAMVEAACNESQRMDRDELQALCERLVTEFASGVEAGDAQGFLAFFREVLRRTEEAGDDPYVWQAPLLVLEEGSSALLKGKRGNRATRRRADILRLARIDISDEVRRMHKQYIAGQRRVADQTSILAISLRQARDEEQMFERLAAYLPLVDIRHCAVAFFEPRGDDPVAFSRLRDVLDPKGGVARFASRRFPPKRLYPTGKPFSLALLPLVVEDEVKGFMAFDTTDLEPYAAIARQLALEYERRQVEERVVYERNLLRTLIDTIPDKVYFKDRESRFILASRSMAEWVNLDDPEELVGKSDFDFFAEEHARQAYGDEQRIIETGKPLVNIEEREVWPDGRETWALTTKMPLRDMDGNIIGTFGISRDTTERRRAEEELRRAHDELAQHAADLERRTEQLRVAAEVAREMAAARDLDELLNRAVDLVHRRFGFYHAGIFMVDEQGEYAVLRAATGEAGRRMLEAGHKLKVGEVGVVGYVTGIGEPRIALDVGEDAVYFDNPFLPKTRSEVALPLKVGERVIGAFDVQSKEEAAFDEEDVTVLGIIADQLAIAIENARLFGRTEAQLRELRRLQGEYSVAAWAELAAQRSLAYVYDRVDVKPAPELSPPVLDTVLERGETVALAEPEAGEAILAAPLKLRGQVIGALGVQGGDGDREWSPTEIALVEAVGEQVALALENARLFEETQQRVQELGVLFDTSRSLAGALDPKGIAESVVREFTEMMGADECSIQLFDPGDARMHILHESEVLGTGVGEEDYVLEDYPSVARAMETLRPVIIHAGESSEDRERAYIEKYNIGTMALIPLVVKGRAIGVVEVDTFGRERSYTSREIDLAVTLSNQAAIALDNARLFEEARIHADELAALNEMGQALAARLDLQEVLNEIYRSASRLMDTTNFFIGLYDPAKDEVTFALDVTESEEDRQIAVVPSSEGLTGYIVRNREAVLIGENVEERLAEMGVELLGQPFRSWLGVPLMVGEQVLGLLGVQNYTTSHAYDEHDRDLLTAIAGPAAIAIQNAHLFEETQRRVQELASLNQLSASIGVEMQPDELGRSVLMQLVTLLPTDAAYVALYDEENDEVEVVADFTKGEFVASLSPPSKLGKGRTGYIIRNRCPLLLRGDIRDACRSLGIESSDERARSFVGVPMILDERVIGVLAVQSYTRDDAYDEQHQELLATVAGQVAVAFERIRLLDRTRTALVETEALFRASRAIGEAASMQEVVLGAAEIASSLGLSNCSLSIVTVTDSDGLPLRGDLYAAHAEEEGWVAGLPATDVLLSDRLAAQRLLEDPNFVLVYQDAQDPKADIPDAVRGVMRGERLRGAVTAGLNIRGQPLGFLTFSGPAPLLDFPEGHVRRVRTIADQVTVAIENRRLLEETRRRATQLETAAEVSRAASSILNLEELLPQTVNLIRRRFDLYYVGIFLVDETGRWAVLRAGTGGAGQQMLEAGHKLEVGGESMIGWCTAHGEARIALDVSREKVRFEAPLLPYTRSEMALPLVSRGRVIGAMTIQSTQVEAFSQEDITVLQTMADQLANVIENARLFSETEDALVETQELYEASRAIGAASSPSEVGQVLVNYVTHTDLDLARVLLVETTGGEPTHVVLAENWSVDGRPVRPSGTRLPLAELPISRFIQPGEAFVSENVQADARLDQEVRLMMEVIRLQSFALIPLAVGQRAIGGLLVGRDKPSTYSEKLVRNLWTLCGQAAIASEGLRLLEETQRRAQELEAINEMGRVIVSVLDPQALLRQIVDITKARFGHDYVAILLIEGDELVLADSSTIGDSDNRLERRSVSFDLQRPGIVSDTVRSGQPALIDDVLADPRYTTVPELAATRSELTVPIEVKGRVIGALDVQSGRPFAYDETDMILLQALASQAGVAIENARLFEETQAEAGRRALINEVLGAASTSRHPEELLHNAGEVISRRMGMPSVLSLWESDREVLRPVAAHDQDASDVALPDDVYLTRDANPVLFEAVEERRLKVLEEVAEHVDGLSADLVAQLGIRSAVYVPLVSRGRLLGTLELSQVEGQATLNAENLGFVEIVADNLSLALDNARLFVDAVETAERLAEVDRLKSQFLANMSHELRTPLNSIIGFSRVILKGIDGPLTDLQRQDLDAIYNSGQHLLGLINDILEISKIEAGKMELAFEPVDMGEIVRGVMSTAIALVKDKPVELQQSVPDDLPTVVADGRRVRQVLINLVSNAAKFTEEGFIRVEIETGAEFITVSVADSGIGIPEEKIGSLFQAFTQVDASPSRKYGGTGLGLAISKSYIELHGGKIWAESEVGVGSTFRFTLPIKGPPSLQEEAAAEVEQVPEPAPKSVEEEGEAGKLVLCVDDDEGVLTLFQRYLSRQGYRVVGLTDSTRVLEETKRLKPHAVTLDVMMPGKDGWRIIRELKDDPETRHVPVIMCTIVSEKGRGMSLGAADYLVKPILEQDLLAALDRLDREAGRHRVLVVDDQEEDRSLLRRMIESQDGYEVVEAASGQEAIALVRRARPHIIILDLMMPDVDGFAVLEAVKSDELTRSIPIIVVTAKDLTDEDLQQLNHKIDALIQKGVLEREELLEDVSAALRKLGRARASQEADDEG